MFKKMLLTIFVGIFWLTFAWAANNQEDRGYFKEAQKLARRKNYEEALVCYQKALDLNYQVTQIYIAMGDIYTQLQKDEKAINAYKKAQNAPLLRKKDLIKINLNLGSLYYQNKKYVEAMEEYKKVLEFKPKLEEVILKLALIYKKMEMYPEALQEFKKLAKAKRFLSEVYFNSGEIYFKQGLYEKATKTLTRALTHKANTVETHYILGVIYYRQNRLDEALAELNQTLNLQKQVPIYPHTFTESHTCKGVGVYNTLGWIHFAKADYTRAKEAFQQAIKLEPNQIDGYVNLALVYYKEQNMEKTLNNLDKVLDLNKEEPLPYLIKALSYYKANLPTEAKANLAKITGLKNTAWIGQLANQLEEKLTVH